MNKSLSDQQLWLDLKGAICNVLRVSGPGINPAARLIADLGADSIELVDLSSNLRQIAGTDVDFNRIFRQKCAKQDGTPLDITLQEIMDYVRTQVADGHLSRVVVHDGSDQ
jgi:acyl carrier protein